MGIQSRRFYQKIGQWSTAKWHLVIKYGMWLERMQFIGRVIGEYPGSIIDLGAGHQHILKYVKPSEYYPYDIADGFDLNLMTPDIVQVNWVLIIGLLEYLDEPLKLLIKIKDYSDKAIITYNCGNGIQKYHKFKNHYTSKQFQKIIASSGWTFKKLGIKQGSTIYKLKSIKISRL